MQHDQKKVKDAPTDAELEQRRVAVVEFRAILDRAFAARDAFRASDRPAAAATSDDASAAAAAAASAPDLMLQLRAHLDASAPLLERCPDCYSIFACRREVLEAMHKLMAAQAAEQRKQQELLQQQAAASSGSDQSVSAAGAGNERATTVEEETHLRFSKDVLVAEVKFNTDIIRRDYKSYAAWVHRRWVLNAMHGKVRLAVLREEQAKLDQLLTQDERNFHAWGYRRWVTSELQRGGLYSDADELVFATSKIGGNFSNYSAWHNRALVLWKRLALLEHTAQTEAQPDAAEAGQQGAIVDQLTQDQAMLVQAFYCDPNDQSAFVYALNLVDRVHQAVGRIASPPTVAAALRAASASLQKALHDACAELQREEPKCPWPRYVLLRLPLHAMSGAEAAASWRALMELDPLRKRYFAAELAKVAA
jgi:hypothetical protein